MRFAAPDRDSLALRYAHLITRWRWPIVCLWILLTAASLVFMPQLSTVVQSTSTNYIPSSATVVQAQTLLNRVNPGSASASTAVVAIHNAHGLSAHDKQYFASQLQTVDSERQQYGVTQVQDLANTNAQLSASFLSSDGTTEIALIGFPAADISDAVKVSLQKLHTALASPPAGSTVFFTGDAPIQQDDASISQHGVDRTARVTVILVLIILLLILRSLIAPLVTLLAIGLSFLISSGVVAWLALHGLPVSSFTQTFLIVILFGAGTDYSIIIFSRFREELTHAHGNRERALADTLQSVGKTILFSSSTVIVSFAILYVARFGLYRSAVGVAIGVAITLVTCLVFVPSLMSLMGTNLFWPRRPKPGTSHRPSRIWSRTGGMAVRYPWWTLLALALVLVPVALLFTDQRTFNPMDDIPSAPSVKGFNVVSKAFGPGNVLPMQIVLQSPDNLRSPAGLTTIEDLSHALARAPLVAQVDSATRPTGKVVTEFQIANQNRQAAAALTKVASGLTQLGKQLGADNGQSSLNNRQATALFGLPQETAAAAAIDNGLRQSANGASRLAAGAQQLSTTEQQLASLTSSLANAMSRWAATHPDTRGNPQWEQLQQLATKSAGGTTQVAAAATSLQQSSSSLGTHLQQLQRGAAALAPGLQQTATGLSQLSSGLHRAVPGIEQLHNGVTHVQTYLSATGAATTTGDPGFYVPKSTVNTNTSLLQAMNAYLSANGHIAKFTVLLSVNPYSAPAIAAVPSLIHTAQVALRGSPDATGTVLAAGTTPVQNTLNQLSASDFTRTVGLILGAIFLLLVAMLRSIITPIYVIASLSGMYFVTMGLLQTITMRLLHQSGLSWPVPFFTFLLLVALGVDYSIFLMSRFQEELARGLSPSEAITTAMGQMGNVIFSAAVIMAGTFGSMVISGVMSLVEIGLSAVLGLLLYSAIILGLFVPACVAVFGDGHFWPFQTKRARETRADQRQSHY